MQRQIFFAASAIVIAVASASAAPQTADPLYAVARYDAGRDPSADVAAAVPRASAENKRILVEVGGDWCVWCGILDRFVAADPDVHAAMADAFVIVKVNWSRGHENEAFLSQYRTPEGYPDFIILDSDGRYLGAQDTGELEQGRSYNRRSLIAFARQWRR